MSSSPSFGNINALVREFDKKTNTVAKEGVTFSK